jgi:hypothetical protein
MHQEAAEAVEEEEGAGVAIHQGEDEIEAHAGAVVEKARKVRE